MFYNLIIYLYLLGVAIYSLFNEKVRKMWRGEREAFKILREKVDPQAKYVWFHAASLGEFEQGRPLMEQLRREHPEYKILLTSFSPSGYEVRKNYEGADIICYLPLDTPRNARRFVEMVRPEKAFFIKYEFWNNYLSTLKKAGIPVYSISSIFREGQASANQSAELYYRFGGPDGNRAPCPLPEIPHPDGCGHKALCGLYLQYPAGADPGAVSDDLHPHPQGRGR